MVWLYALGSVFLVSLISFVGLLTLAMKEERLKSYIIYLVSFSAGAFFGDVFLHLLPETMESYTISTGLFIISGVAISLGIEKFVRWRHCHLPTTEEHPHPFAMMNLFGDGIHNFIDGVIISASYLASIPLGVATTLAVMFHEIPQELGDFGILIHGGFSKKKALISNFLTALAAIFGAMATLIAGNVIQNTTSFLIPFSIGSFLYIAGSDIIPEIHKETGSRKSLLQLIAFLLGVGVMYLLLFLE